MVVLINNKDNVDEKVIQTKNSLHVFERIFIERMRRSGTNNNGHPGGPSEFHFDVPQIPIWHNNSMQPPIHLHLLPTGSHTGLDPLMNNPVDQLDRKFNQFQSKIILLSL